MVRKKSERCATGPWSLASLSPLGPLSCQTPSIRRGNTVDTPSRRRLHGVCTAFRRRLDGVYLGTRQVVGVATLRLPGQVAIRPALPRYFYNLVPAAQGFTNLCANCAHGKLANARGGVPDAAECRDSVLECGSRLPLFRNAEFNIKAPEEHHSFGASFQLLAD